MGTKDTVEIAGNAECVCGKRNLISIRRNLGQVPVDAGHSELDLVTHTLRWTFSCVYCRDAEEQQAEQWDPQGVRTEMGVRLGGETTAVTSFRRLHVVAIHS